ncbi:MAG: shikimate dehydrogenase [Bacteroidaceae bacterium]|nr:shikimate dehydrogenase [Bacteroidaceae bacterium]MBR5764504.1 shikimate dehydrogenase [Bacteroidaceae bacterium]
MDKYGLIGNPLGHSFSKGYFNEKFSNENIDAEYVNFEIPTIDDLPAVIAENKNLCGLNVTIPYKEKVISYLDEVTTDARAIGAVNVIRIERNAKGEPRLIGYNSDIVGFTQSIEPMLESHHKKALILGTGGASKAIFHGLKKLGIEGIFVSRKNMAGTVQYKDITPEVIQEYNVIVNCTPCGMYPHTDECPDLPYEAITEKNLLYDLIYNPDQTLFMRKGAERGAKVKNGLEMLLLQAFDSWRFWNSTRY